MVDYRSTLSDLFFPTIHFLTESHTQRTETQSMLAGVDDCSLQQCGRVVYSAALQQIPINRHICTLCSSHKKHTSLLCEARHCSSFAGGSKAVLR